MTWLAKCRQSCAWHCAGWYFIA